MAEILASWQAPEFEQSKKTADWYWAVWIIVISISVIAVLFHDTLLAVIIIVGVFCLSLMSTKPPRLVQYEISQTGVRIGNVLYPYETLESFGIEEIDGLPPKLLLKSKKLFMSLIIIPISGIHREEIKGILDKYMIEESLNEPLMQKIADFLGF